MAENKKFKKSTPKVSAEPITLPSSAELLEALFFFWDGFERATMNFFLIRDTADQVKRNEQLSGTNLTLGIRKLEWVGGQQPIFRAFMEHEKCEPIKKEDNCLIFKYKNVFVYLYVYEDNPCLTSLDVVFYENETFNTPNPLDTFSKQYDNL